MKKIAKWEIFELTLTSGAEVGNPFIEADVYAVFTHKDHVDTVDGFYDGIVDGRHIWRVRFAPYKEGKWQYRTVSNIPDLDGKGGSLLCVPAVSRGGLTVNPRFGNWFFREDGSPQFIVNEGWYPHPGNGHELEFEDVDFPQPSEEDMNAYFKILSDHGVNMVVDIAQLYARQSEITDPSYRWPWKVIDAKHNKIDRDRFNLDFYQRMDRTMAYAKEKSLFFAMELLYDNSVVRPREWSMHPLNVNNGGWLEGNEHGTGWDVMFNLENKEHVKYITRYLKYTIARFAAYWNVYWCIGSENGNLIRLPDSMLPHALFPADKAAAWYNYWGEFIARKDPYGRLRTFGDAGKQPLMVYNTYNNVLLTQDPRDYPKGDVKEYFKAMNAFGEDFWYYGRPVVVGEMTAGTNNQYDVERRLYWIGLTSGYMMGRADRHFGPVIGGKHIESEKFNGGKLPPIYGDLSRMAEFIESEQVHFWRMRPHDDLLDTENELIYCLAANGEEYLVYFVYGGDASLDLPESAYAWLNPRTGEIHATGKVKAGKVAFAAPDEQDWVLHVLASGRQ